MNKKEFIEEVKKRTNYSENECVLINNVFENHSLIGNNSKEKVLNELVKSLKVNRDEADNIYNTVHDIFINAIKDKIKHPFKSKRGK